MHYFSVDIITYINSKHFLDQAENYQKGIFKNVNFYKEDIEKNAQRTYHPGE